MSQEAKYLWDGNWRVRGNNPPVAGLYLGWAKIAAMWVVFVAWAWVADWANRDMDDNNLNWQMWNPVIVGSFMGTLLLTWIVPWFWLNVFLLLGAAVGPLAAFVVQRNGQLPSHQHVFTQAHLRYWLSDRLKTIGLKVAAEDSDPNTGGVPVKLYARGGATPPLMAPSCWRRGRLPACLWPARCSTKA